MALDELLLLTGNDIPFEAGRLIIHPPTLKEIAFIGEEAFFIGCQSIILSKNFIGAKDNNELDNFTDFDIFMILMTEKHPNVKIIQNYIKTVLVLLFPLYTFSFENDKIIFHNIEDETQTGFLSNENFGEFRNFIVQMFCLNEILNGEIDNYNPSGPLAKKISDKLKERHKKLAELKYNETGRTKISILARYQSILGIGLGIPITSFKD